MACPSDGHLLALRIALGRGLRILQHRLVDAWFALPARQALDSPQAMISVVVVIVIMVVSCSLPADGSARPRAPARSAGTRPSSGTGMFMNRYIGFAFSTSARAGLSGLA